MHDGRIEKTRRDPASRTETMSPPWLFYFAPPRERRRGREGEGEGGGGEKN